MFYARGADGLVTGQFLTQCGKGFVGSQGAGVFDLGFFVLGGVRSCTGLGWAGGSGFRCFGHVATNLFLVCFPACLCVSVLLFPSGAFFFVTFHPFVGFRIEAFWVLVVAVFVVVGSHTVEGWVEVGAFWVDAFVGLFERQ